MGIGVGLVFIAVGAVLTFAVHATLSGVNIQVVGVILMAVGAVGLLIDLTVFAPRRRSVTTYSTTAQPAAPVATMPASETTRIET
jgi:uncharacterized protein DUF6458